MLVLGLSGGMLKFGRYHYPVGSHDSAACVVQDGQLVAAVEEERFSRIKKGWQFPKESIDYCLSAAGASISDVDCVAFYFGEAFIDRLIEQQHFYLGLHPTRLAADLIRDWFAEEYDWRPDVDQLRFVDHHTAHAMSSFVHSGFDEALTVVLDGNGDHESGTIFSAAGPTVSPLRRHPIQDSLGFFYLAGTRFLGYGQGDEYKVMGLASSGDASAYREIFGSLYRLKDAGGYELYPQAGAPDYFINGIQDWLGAPYMYLARACIARGIVPRHPDDPVSEDHANFAAGLQEVLEEIVLHLMGHWSKATGATRLCFSGGVAQNSRLNGAILRSGLFPEVYIDPASHDAGAAVGAAYAIHAEHSHAVPTRSRLRSASLGPSLLDGSKVRDLGTRLSAWSDLIEYEQVDDPVEVAATRLAEDRILGWATGRSEFGPRALGNRSIIADPRWAHNQARINEVTKQREGFRPFAPVTTEAAAPTYFELPPVETCYGFMSYVVDVVGARKGELGAVTHVDGTARVQIIDEDINPAFFRLVCRFGELTGTPVVLNTSFNNSFEPIVLTVDDVVTCLLTADLDATLVEDFVVTRRPDLVTRLDALELQWRPTTWISSAHLTSPGAVRSTYEIGDGLRLSERRTEISPNVAEALAWTKGNPVLVGDLVAGSSAEQEGLRLEILDLWRRRFIRLAPPPQGVRA